MLDLLFTRCRVPHYKELMDLGICSGKIAYIADHSACRPNARETMDLHGKLLLPGIVEAHIHLDKAFLLERLSGDVSTLRDAIDKTAELKSGYTADDIEARSLRAIRQAVARGVTRMRCHVEVDPIVKLVGLETTLALKERLKDIIDLQIVAFPQEGVFNHPETSGLMERAVAMGADVVGGITYNDRNLREHLEFVFRLAERYGRPVDLHVDFSDRPEELAVLEVLQFTRRFAMQGKVSVGHLTSLGSVPKARAESIAEDIAGAGIHVITLPATDLYLNGRGDEQCIRRGITPVKLLLEQGASVLYGSNNIENAFTPFGTADPLDIGYLVAQTCHMGSGKDAETLIEMATTRAAAALGFECYGLNVGAEADLAVCQAADARTLLYHRPERLQVYRKGRLIARNEIRRTDWMDGLTI